jgi:hypothetical protein
VAMAQAEWFLRCHRWIGRGSEQDFAVALARCTGAYYPLVRDACMEMQGVGAAEDVTMGGMGALQATIEIPNPSFRSGNAVNAGNPVNVNATYAVSMLGNLGTAQHKALDVVAEVTTAGKAALLARQNRALAPGAAALAAADYTGGGAVAHGTEQGFANAFRPF